MHIFSKFFPEMFKYLALLQLKFIMISDKLKSTTTYICLRILKILIFIIKFYFDHLLSYVQFEGFIIWICIHLQNDSWILSTIVIASGEQGSQSSSDDVPPTLCEPKWTL